MRKFLQAMRYFRSFLALQHTDIILAAYPKSGSTWLRFMLCNVGSLLEWDGKKIDFEILNKTMIGLSGNLLKPWNFKRIPRVIVTHLRYLPVFNKCSSILLIRDPRDVMVVYFHYVKHLQGVKPFKGNFHEFIRHPKLGLKAWFKHYLSWKRHAGLMVTYEALRKNTYKELQKILHFLKVTCPENVIVEAIARSSLSSIRKIEENKGLSGGKLTGIRFTDYSEEGIWHSWFDNSDLEYLRTFKEKYKIEIPYK